MSGLRQLAVFVTMLLASACAPVPVSVDAGARIPEEARPHLDAQIVVTIIDPVGATRPRAGASARPYAARSRYAGSVHAQRVAAELARDYRLARVASWRIDALGVHCVVYQLPPDVVRDAALALLRRDSRVESAQPMHGFSTMTAEAAYDDPYFELQTAVQALRVPAAHRWAQGRRVRVAIVDTGVDLRHPELAGRVVLARNFVDGDAEQFESDRHGTAVAGLVAAASGNGIGIVGVAPQVDILALKACWERAGEQGAQCNTLTLAAALAAAIEHRAQVINLSLAGPEDALLRRLLEQALQRGTTIVAAHAATGRSRASFPTSMPGVLAVADADVDLGASGAIAAPGRHALTLIPRGRFDYVSGVSLSAAMVSGVVALMLEHRRLPPDEVASVLEDTAARPGARGSGRLVDACAAVAVVVGAEGCAPMQARARDQK